MDYLAELEKSIKNIKIINNIQITSLENNDKVFNTELDESEKEMIIKNYKKPWSRLNADQKNKLLLDYSKSKNADFSVLKSALRDKLLEVSYNQDKMSIDTIKFKEIKIKDTKEIKDLKTKELNIE
jgi:hypothetical protein